MRLRRKWKVIFCEKCQYLFEPQQRLAIFCLIRCWIFFCIIYFETISLSKNDGRKAVTYNNRPTTFFASFFNKLFRLFSKSNTRNCSKIVFGMKFNRIIEIITIHDHTKSIWLCADIIQRENRNQTWNYFNVILWQLWTLNIKQKTNINEKLWKNRIYHVNSVRLFYPHLYALFIETKLNKYWWNTTFERWDFDVVLFIYWDYLSIYWEEKMFGFDVVIAYRNKNSFRKIEIFAYSCHANSRPSSNLRLEPK